MERLIAVMFGLIWGIVFIALGVGVAIASHFLGGLWLALVVLGAFAIVVIGVLQLAMIGTAIYTTRKW